MTFRTALHTVLTLALATAAAGLCRWLHAPLPWMIGPLVATAIASVLGAPTQSWNPLRNSGQWVIGAALGLYFTAHVTALVLQLWWAIALGIGWALLLGWGFGRWLHRSLAGHLPGSTSQLRATSYFAGAIGGASEMTLLAEREGGRTDLVAAAHSVRLLIVTLTIPFAFSFSGLHGIEVTSGPRHIDGLGLLLLGGATAAGASLMRLTGRANPWFMGPLLVAMGLTMTGIELSALPDWLPSAAQLVIGVSLGVRFRAEFVRTAPRWLGMVTLGTVVMMGLCAAAALLLSLATGLRPATLVLGTSPGGIAEMAITAKALELGAPVVTAFQVCRLIAVLVLVKPLYRLTRHALPDAP